MSNIDCLLTQGFGIGCRDNSGGIKKVYLANWEELTYTEDSNGIITGITASSVNFEFHEYTLQKNISMLQENITMTPENETVVYAPEIMIVLNKLDSAKRTEIALIAKSLIVAVVLDMNGKYWLVGKDRGLDLTTALRQTGTAQTDRNGTDFTLTGSEPNPFQEITFSAFEALIAI
jgi:hypothetical protein